MKKLILALIVCSTAFMSIPSMACYDGTQEPCEKLIKNCSPDSPHTCE